MGKIPSWLVKKSMSGGGSTFSGPDGSGYGGESGKSQASLKNKTKKSVTKGAVGKEKGNELFVESQLKAQSKAWYNTRPKSRRISGRES